MRVGEAAVFGLLSAEADCTLNPSSRIVPDTVGRMLSVSRQVKRTCAAEEQGLIRCDFLQSGGIASVGLAFAKPQRLFSQVTALIVGTLFK